jgi:hypothetical protein
MKKIFLSYARDDYPFAHQLLAALRKVKVEGWMDTADVAAGGAIGGDVRSAIKHSSAMIVLVSRRSLESNWVNFEIGAGLALRKPIIPILIKDGDLEHDLPAMLKDIQFLDARNKPVDEVIRDIERAIKGESE